MKRKYEAMIVLDMKGKEESVEQLVAGISRDFETSGAKLEQIDHLGKRQFPFSPRHVTSGYFVNFQIEADNTALESMRAKLKLNENVYQQYYQRVVA
ncbi:MAG: 30S ribosomal protein S6 [Prosthecobacter sp.]